MPRKGKGLEQLVSLLEQHLAAKGAKVTSPDSICDKATGQSREVDVSIRSEVGSTPVLVILECRDRARAQGVEWIEQLAEKRNSVGADVAVAVSSSGFTGPAERKAQALGVQTRRLDEVTADVVSSWCLVEHVTLGLKRAEFVAISMGVDPDTASTISDEAAATLQRRDYNAPVFAIKQTGEPCSLTSIWFFISQHHDVYAGVKPDGSRLRRTIQMNFGDPSQRYQIPGHPAPIDIEKIEITADLWIDITEVSPQRRAAYATVDGATHAQVVEFGFDVDGRKRTLSFVNREGSGTSVSIRESENAAE